MDADAHERWILENADYFVACAFRGRGVYERVECRDLASAIEAARGLTSDRGVMIYAVRGNSQALVATVAPQGDTAA